MKKLVLGIIAVFCLQVGFIAYNASHRSDDAVSKTVSYSVSNPVSSPGEQLNNAAEPLEVSEPLTTDNDAVISAKSESPDGFRPMIAEHRAGSPQFNRKAVKVVAKDPIFHPTVITIPPQKPVEFRFKREYASLLTEHPSENSDVATVQTQRQEKRSFLSKAIRKPYDLIKAIGSKF